MFEFRQTVQVLILFDVNYRFFITISAMLGLLEVNYSVSHHYGHLIRLYKK